MTKLEQLVVESFHPSLHGVLLHWARDPKKGLVADKLTLIEHRPLSAVADAYFVPHYRVELRDVPASRLRVQRDAENDDHTIYAVSEAMERKKRSWHWPFAA